MISAVASVAFMTLSAERALAERRVALVIGNSTYKNASLNLTNPKNDSTDVADVLRKLEFEVIHASDANKRELEMALQKFARVATDADSALFFYAGHAMQYQGRNYLMPIDAELEDEISLRYQMVAIDDVRNALDRANGVKIMILDACRNNPLADRLIKSVSGLTRAVGQTRGLARVDKTQGMVVAYATAADDVAQDGSGRNSPFTTALLKRLQEPGLEIEMMFRRIASDVNSKTNGKQRPETYISLLSEYYLNQSDRLAWERVKDSGDPAALKDFIARFPSSIRALDARYRVELLERFAREREQEKQQSEQKAIADATARAKQLAEQQANADAAARAKQLAEQQVVAEVAARANAEAEQKSAAAAAHAKQLAEQKQAADAAAHAQQTAAQQAAADAAARARADAEQKAAAAAQAKLLAEQQAAAQQAAVRARAEAEQQAKLEAAQKAAAAKAQVEQQAKLEAAQRMAAESDRRRVAEVAEQACRQEDERLALLQAAGNGAREELISFERELSCDRLRPIVLTSLGQLTGGVPQQPGQPAVSPSPPVAAIPTVPTGQPSTKEIQLITAAQDELRRVGCFPGKTDGKLNSDTKKAIKDYLTERDLPTTEINVTESLVLDLKEQSERICACPAGKVAKGLQCVADPKVKPQQAPVASRPERQRPAPAAQRPVRQEPRPAVAARPTLQPTVRAEASASRPAPKVLGVGF